MTGRVPAGGKGADRNREEAEFLRGATAVLAHMHMSDSSTPTLYREVVTFIGAKALIEQARRDGAMRWSGLAAYVASDKRRSEMLGEVSR